MRSGLGSEGHRDQSGGRGVNIGQKGYFLRRLNLPKNKCVLCGQTKRRVRKIRGFGKVFCRLTFLGPRPQGSEKRFRRSGLKFQYVDSVATKLDLSGQVALLEGGKFVPKFFEKVASGVHVCRWRKGEGVPKSRLLDRQTQHATQTMVWRWQIAMRGVKRGAKLTTVTVRFDTHQGIFADAGGKCEHAETTSRMGAFAVQRRCIAILNAGGETVDFWVLGRLIPYFASGFSLF